MKCPFTELTVADDDRVEVLFWLPGGEPPQSLQP